MNFKHDAQENIMPRMAYGPERQKPPGFRLRADLLRNTHGSLGCRHRRRRRHGTDCWRCGLSSRFLCLGRFGFRLRRLSRLGRFSLLLGRCRCRNCSLGGRCSRRRRGRRLGESSRRKTSGNGQRNQGLKHFESPWIISVRFSVLQNCSALRPITQPDPQGMSAVVYGYVPFCDCRGARAVNARAVKRQPRPFPGLVCLTCAEHSRILDRHAHPTPLSQSP